MNERESEREKEKKSLTENLNYFNIRYTKIIAVIIPRMLQR